MREVALSVLTTRGDTYTYTILKLLQIFQLVSTAKSSP